MAESVVTFLIDQLSTLIEQESKLLGELKPSVQSIKGELDSMKAFLRDAESMESNGSELQAWVKQVREVAYDIEDVLDDFAFHFARHRANGFCGRVQKIYSSIKNLGARHRISSEIKDIKARLTDIFASHQRLQTMYGTQERASTSANMQNLFNDIRASSILMEEDKLVGINEPKRKLMLQILDENSHLKVISVVGMGGLGKTTLVRKVYDDAAVKKQFQSHAWLTVSQTFNLMVTIKNLIQQLYDAIREPVPQVESMDVIRLSALVKDFLRERRYILVLDDVWITESWEAIKPVLPDGKLGSRIILTTRRADVAYVSCLESHNHLHKMESLSNEESWTLFCNRTFQSNPCPQHLEDVSRRILRKCEGLPLAIVTISGVLALKDKDRISEWEMIFQSVGGELEGSRIKRILLLSYNDLPYYLKSCFLYLSIYPEDYTIEVDDLLQKWIAQGFVQEKQGISSIDVATRYANELINRSLIQEVTTSPDRSLLSFRVHDFLHDLIVSKSRKQNFITVATGSYYNRGRSDKVRRLAIHDFVDNEQPQELDGCFKSLQSLEFFGYISPLSASVLSKLLSGRLLKVLDLRGAPLEEIPEEVFKLFHLKYLCLRDTQVRIIPKYIGKLQNLEFLDLSHSNVTKIPVEILKLRKLHSLLAGQWGDYSENYATRGFRSPDRIGKLFSLENLSAIEAYSNKIVKEIGKLTRLMKLTVTNLKREDGNEFLSSLVKLTNLRELSVSSINEDEILDLQHSIPSTLRFLTCLVLEGRLERVPQWVVSLQGLTILHFLHSGLKEDDAIGGIESLQSLPNLVVLTLNNAYEGETLCFNARGFQKLKELELVKLERLRMVRMEKDTMPNLQSLIMTDCKLVEELPLGIENLSKLESLALMDMSNELIQKVKNLNKESEEYQIIAHIPEVCIGYWMNGEWNTSFL